MTYTIKRMYQEPDFKDRVMKSGQTLEQAQAHCKDPETSSSSCSETMYTAEHMRSGSGQWFDGFEEE